MFSISYVDGRGTRETFYSSPTEISSAVNTEASGNISLVGVAKQGETLSFENNIFDQDGIGTLRYQWYADNQPMAANTASSLELDQSHVGKEIILGVFYTDELGFNEEIYSSASNAVEEVNEAPVFLTVDDFSITGGSYLSTQIQALDPDINDELVYSISTEIDWLEIDEETGFIYGIPDPELEEQGVVTVTATDNSGSRALVTFNISVTPKPLSEIDLNLPDPMGLSEFRYTNQADNIRSSSFSLSFGLGGDDELNAVSGGNYQFLSGGEGDDLYQIPDNDSLSMVVVDFANSTNDKISAPALDLSSDYTAIFTIDNAHLVIGNVLLEQEFWVLNWKDNFHRVEAFELGNDTYSYSQLVNSLTSFSNYYGNLSWADLAGASGSSQFDKSLVDSTINFYSGFNSNLAPQIEMDDDLEIYSGYSFEKILSIADENVESVDVEIISKPSWLSYSEVNLELTGNLSQEDLGENRIVLRATDEYALSTQKVFVVDVKSANSALKGKPELTQSDFTLTIEDDNLIDLDGIVERKYLWEIFNAAGTRISSTDGKTISLRQSQSDNGSSIGLLELQGQSLEATNSLIKFTTTFDGQNILAETDDLGNILIPSIPNSVSTATIHADSLNVRGSVEVKDDLNNIELAQSDILQLNNFSFAINISDLIMVLENIVGLRTFSTEQHAVADTNLDGSVAISDVLTLLEQLMGLSSTPAPRVVSDNYFTTKKFSFESIEEQDETLNFDIVLDFTKLVNEFEDEINGFTFTIDNFETVEEIFSNSSDDILFQTSDDGEFAFVFDVTGGSNLTALEKQSIFSASITKDANGLSSFNADLEISFVGSEILEKQEFVFNFDERNYIDGAINLSGTETKYICFMPGDVNNSLNDITVYELI